MIKLFKRNSKVMTVETGDSLLRCCAVQNRDGSVSLGIINRHPEATEITLDSSLFKKNIRVYEYDPAMSLTTVSVICKQAAQAYLMMLLSTP